jgi:membrane protein implicated in regulation of membrane protease activity
MEVTTKEAEKIHRSRYFDSLGKKRYFWPAMLVVALLIGYGVIYYVNTWIGLVVFAVIYFAAVFFMYRLSNKAKKYAEEQTGLMK